MTATPSDGGAGEADPSPRERRPFVPRVVWVLTGLWALILLGYAVLLPVYQAPDEPQHVDLVLAMRDRLSYPNYDELLLSPGVRRSAAMALVGRGNWTPSPVSTSPPPVAIITEGAWNLLASEAPPRSTRPSFERLARGMPTPTPAEIAARPAWYRNYLTQHPPLYYELLGRVLDVAPGEANWSFDRVVGFLRICSALLLVPIPALAYRAARRIGVAEHAAVAAATFPLAVPQLAHIGASVNNDDLLILLAAIVTVFVARIVAGDLSTRTAVLTGVAGGLAWLTKGFAMFIPPWIVIAYVGAGIRERSRALRAGLWAIGVMVVVGGWWWVRNLVEFKTLQPHLSFVPPRPGFSPDAGWYVRRFGAFLVERSWGWFAWLHAPTRMPLVAITLATIVTAAAIVIALVHRRSAGLRWRLVFLLLPGVMLAAYTGAQGYSAYASTGGTPAIQGRYLFAGLTGAAVVVGQGVALALGRRSRYAAVAVLTGAVAMHATAFGTITGAFWGRPGASIPDRIRALAAWSPWPAAVLAVGAFVLLAMLVWALTETARIGAREARVPA